MKMALGDLATACFGAALDDRAVRVHQVVTAHPGFAGDAGGDDHDVGVRGLVIPVRADDTNIALLYRRCFEHVEGFPLRDAFDHINKHNLIGEGLVREPLRGRCSDVPCADHGDLHGCLRS